MVFLRYLILSTYIRSTCDPAHLLSLSLVLSFSKLMHELCLQVGREVSDLVETSNILAQMSSILNKSISPHGSHSIVGSQPSSQIRRQVKVVAGSHSSTESGYRRTQLGAEHKRLNGVLGINKSDASKPSHLLPEGEICQFVPDQIAQINRAKAFRMVPDDAVFERISLGFIWPLMEKTQMSIIKDKVAGLDIFGTQSAAGTLTVSVSSAMKLQHHQLDQIAKKMQRITGATRVSVKNTIDLSLIAGFVISYEKEGSHTIDLSVKGKLDKLAAHIESEDQNQLSSSGSYMFMNR